MVHLDSTWSSCELHVDYGHKFGRATTKVKCTWSPGGLQKIHLDSGGVHLEKVGQGKVLGFAYSTIHAFSSKCSAIFLNGENVWKEGGRHLDVKQDCELLWCVTV